MTSNEISIAAEPGSLDGFEQRLLGELRVLVEMRAARAPAARRPPRRAPCISRGRLVGGVAVVACASGTVGGLALAGSLSTTAINPQSWVDGQRVAPSTGVAPDQAADLEILRRPRVASDALPPDEAQTLTGSPAAANGANPDLSRRAQGFTDGAAWLIPGDGRICFLYDIEPTGGGGTCQPDSAVADNDWPVLTGSSGSAPGQTSVAGVVPDGVSQVTLNLVGGATVVTPVHENVYMTVVQGGLASVTYQGSSGLVTLGN